MNDFIRLSLYQAHHEIVSRAAAGRQEEVVDVEEPVRESRRFLCARSRNVLRSRREI